MKKTANKRTRILVLILIGIVLLAGIVTLLLLRENGVLSRREALVFLETPDKVSVSDREPFSLALYLSDLGEALYPAASFSICFDAANLEFLGIAEGNVRTLGGQGDSPYRLPTWSVNVARSNETGKINLMYLDTTGGKYAFTRAALSEEDNILLYLNFRLRGSVRAGDVYELYFEDAVFAASDETQSLAMSRDTLRTKSGRIVIGDAT